MSGAAPSTITRRKRQARGTGFERLRAAGLEHLQRSSGQVWTDHNLHDPGITLLESLCFALTELAYRAEFPVADLLAGPAGRIDFEDLALHPPQHALPCHALTVADHRRRLLDLVPGLDDVRLVVQRPGVLQLQVKLSDSGPALPGEGQPDAEALAALVARRWRAERPLGEDLAARLERVEERSCDLCATLEMGGPHDPAEVLAEVYHRAAAVVNRVARLASRRELVERGLSLDQIHDGPEARHGFTVADSPAPGGSTEATDLLYVDDIGEQVRQVPGVKAVVDLSLQLADGTVVRSVTPWGGEGWALRLRVPGRPGGQAALRVSLQRRSHRLDVDPTEVWRRVQDLRAAVRGERQNAARSLQDQEAARLPVGRHRPPGPYVSLQQHLPAVYGVGVHGVPDSYGRERQAQARQLQAYLLLFDQVLANGLAQLSHVHELFAAGQAARRTVWWQVLDAQQVPGLAELLEAGREAYEDEVLRPLDDPVRRRHRVLDHLLALHGEALPQNAMRLHCGHLSAQELDALLLRNKAAWLKDVVMLARWRSRGFDDTRPAWPDPGDEARDRHNTSGMARRVALLLGFEQVHARPLASLGLHRHRRAELRAAARPLVADPAWLRAAATHGHLRVHAPDRGRQRELWLHPEATSAAPALRLGVFARSLRAQRVARWLRGAALDLQTRTEGLHLVEHVLLRPVRDASPEHEGLANGLAWTSLRLTVVFPNWTVRTVQPAFEPLAQETVRLNCPAHLLPGLLWLGPAALADFERRYRRWLDLRRNWVLDPSPGHAQALDRQSAQVIRWLQQARAGAA